MSPDRGSTPTSPYSVPQIAPLPSSTLCPICKTSDLTSAPSQPNFNTCTQCHNKVCNQCGFNPNPHLTQVTTSAPLPPPVFPRLPCFPFPLSPTLFSCSFPLATGICVFLGSYSGSRGGGREQALALDALRDSRSSWKLGQRPRAEDAFLPDPGLAWQNGAERAKDRLMDNFSQWVLIWRGPPKRQIPLAIGQLLPNCGPQRGMLGRGARS